MMHLIKFTFSCVLLIASLGAVSNQAQKPGKADTLPVDPKIEKLRQVIEAQDRKMEDLLKQSDSTVVKLQDIAVTAESTETVMTDTYKRAMSLVYQVRNLSSLPPTQFKVQIAPLRPILFMVPESKPVELPDVEPPVVSSKGFFKRIFHR